MEKGALSNITVLDLTRVLAGPYCTAMLADMGAEVIKIEIPGKGDDTRGMGPFKNGESMYYANINRNKYGVTLNLKSDEGKRIFKELVKKADVVVENYRPGVMDKLGLGYEILKEVNPQIIYAAVSGFGFYGSYHERPGYDIIAQAMGGLMSITGPENGTPTRAGNAMGDVLGGMNLTIGILVALNARQIIKRGQRVDVSLVDSVVSALETGTQRYFVNNEIPKLLGNRYAAVSPYDSFKSKDGMFVIGCGNQKLFTLLCNQVLKRPDLLENPLFLTNHLRCENHASLKIEIEKWSVTVTSKEAVEMILAAGVPAAPILNLKDITEDKHIAEEREMFVTIEHPIIGTMRVNGNPIKLMDTMPKIRTCAPLLGQHTEEIYKKILNLSEEEIKNYQEKGVM